MTESIISLPLFPFFILSTFSNCSLSTHLRFVYTTKSMLMTVAVRLILMEIPTALKVPLSYIIRSPLPQLPWARMCFHIVHLLGLKVHTWLRTVRLGTGRVQRHPRLIILPGPEFQKFSEEYFSLIRRSCFFRHVPSQLSYPPSPASSVSIYLFSSLKMGKQWNYFLRHCNCREYLSQPIPSEI